MVTSRSASFGTGLSVASEPSRAIRSTPADSESPASEMRRILDRLCQSMSGSVCRRGRNCFRGKLEVGEESLEARFPFGIRRSFARS
jgi:hypothetical protein